MNQRIYKNIDHPSISTSFNNIAEVYREQGELQKSLEFH